MCRFVVLETGRALHSRLPDAARRLRAFEGTFAGALRASCQHVHRFADRAGEGPGGLPTRVEGATPVTVTLLAEVNLLGNTTRVPA